ncbi:murein L,D-transpeptidase [Actinacidiphila oryziradicis]|uniref:Murein L,D-transpeptidase n=2 Tax=Actinacidiphila oryziradicis TaxID=2571141 RepID=A0A4U0S358_9ACTN|nr:murein L,D-transpeptidase [Actinacidiphila oryziradicis]
MHDRRMRVAVAAAVAALAAGSLAGCKAQGAQNGQAGRPGKSIPASGAAASSPSATSGRRPAAEPTVRPAARPVIASGSSGDRVRELQARLRQLGLFGRNPTGYYGTVTAAAVRTFQSGHGLAGTGQVTTTTWARLRALTQPPSHTAMYPPTANPAAELDARCLTGRVLCVSKTSRTLSWVVDGKVRSAMDVRFGAQYTPTREGTFRVNFKSRHHVSTIYHTAMPYAMFFSGGQAVHYSSDFAARGYAGASHGCVNVRDLGKISALFDQVRTGDKVVIHW